MDYLDRSDVVVESHLGFAMHQFRVPKGAKGRIRKVERLVQGVSPESEVTVTLEGSTAKLDAVLVDVLRLISGALAAGQPVTVVLGATEHSELSSQEVADLLNVSRPYVVKLASTGQLPHLKVGNRYRFLRSDVVAYDRLMSHRRGEALAELAPVDGYAKGDF